MGDDVDLVEVRSLGPRLDARVLSLPGAALMVGVRAEELAEAIRTFGACVTDGYVVRPHATLYGAAWG